MNAKLIEHFEKHLDVPIVRAIALCPKSIPATVGDVFEAAREAGYPGIMPKRTPKPLDGSKCPTCGSHNTWESHSNQNGGIYCRDLMCDSNE